MIFADKLIRLRKKFNYSQEELAEMMNVSRQAVSKWEGAQSTPDLEKILRLGEIFGVTTDYLLKDEIEDEEFSDDDRDFIVKRISLETANEYLEYREKASRRIAIATVLCITSFLPIFVLDSLSKHGIINVTEQFVGVIGTGFMLVIIAFAVSVFIYTSFKNTPYQFLDKEIFEVDYGVKGMVKQRQKSYSTKYMRGNIVGVAFSILAAIPLFITSIAKDNLDEMFLVLFTIVFVSVAVYSFIVVGVKWHSMQKLLQEADYSKEKKAQNKSTEVISVVYWLLVTAIYLGISFITNNWGQTWIIWPVVAILYPVVIVISGLLINNKKH